MTVRGTLQHCEKVILLYDESNIIPDNIEQIIGEKSFKEAYEYCKCKGWKLIHDTILE